MIALLPMYDEGAARAANDALWRAWSRALRASGVDAPAGLARDGRYRSHWRHASLLVGQTCCLPWVDGLEAHARIVALPQYTLAECADAAYRSLLVVRRDAPVDDLPALAGAVVAINGLDSHSGHTALVVEMERRGLPRPFFGRHLVSGAHSESLRMVAAGEADIAAIDCVSHAHFRAAGNPGVAATRIIGRTPPAPAPPLITAAGQPPEIDAILRRTLAGALAESGAGARLFLAGAVAPDAALGRRLDPVRRARRRSRVEGIAATLPEGP